MPVHQKFPRSARITRSGDYTRVFKQGIKTAGPYFICYVDRAGEPGSRLGLAVSRKVGNAVARNRIKRFLREFFRARRGRFLVGANMVVVARPACAQASSYQCAASLEQMLQREGIL